jgi:hypothetical protein
MKREMELSLLKVLRPVLTDQIHVTSLSDFVDRLQTSLKELLKRDALPHHVKFAEERVARVLYLRAFAQPQGDAAEMTRVMQHYYETFDSVAKSNAWFYFPKQHFVPSLSQIEEDLEMKELPDSNKTCSECTPSFTQHLQPNPEVVWNRGETHQELPVFGSFDSMRNLLYHSVSEGGS